MGFTRSPSGLNNYARFFGAEVTVFVEGSLVDREPANAAARHTADEIFHQSILSEFYPQKVFKIKSVGCKNDVAHYATKIGAGEIGNCIVIFDKDLEGILTSWHSPPWILRTGGYSWESDLWTPRLCADVIATLTGGADADSAELQDVLRRASHRVARLSRIDAVCRVYGLRFITPNSKSVGVKTDPRRHCCTGEGELKRLVAALRANSTVVSEPEFTNGMIDQAKRSAAHEVVRGHLWEHICMQVITLFVKKISSLKSVPADLVRNVALSKFASDPRSYLREDVVSHYENQCARLSF